MIRRADSLFASSDLRRRVHTVKKIMIDEIQPQPSENVRVSSVQVAGGTSPAASQSSALHLPVVRPSSLRFGFSRFQHANALIDMRQSNCNSESLAFAALDGEFAAVLAHNSTHN